MYFQLVAFCSFAVAIFGALLCLRKKEGCNRITLMALIGMLVFVNVVAVNVYYTATHYTEFLEKRNEFFTVLAVVAMVDLIVYFAISTCIKQIRNHMSLFALLLIISLIGINGYYFTKSLKL
jgi:hypothetical protein